MCWRVLLACRVLLLQVKGFEAIRGVTLDAEQFSVENDCMTPTFKFKRPQLQKRYQVGGGPVLTGSSPLFPHPLRSILCAASPAAQQAWSWR